MPMAFEVECTQYN